MPPELRKRKAPAVETAAAPPAKKKGPVAKAVAKVKEVIAPKAAAKPNGDTSSSKVAVGNTITLEGFGGEIETNDGAKTTLKKLVSLFCLLSCVVYQCPGEQSILRGSLHLDRSVFDKSNADFEPFQVDDSKSGVVLFTYPKASTPGCKDNIRM